MLVACVLVTVVGLYLGVIGWCVFVGWLFDYAVLALFGRLVCVCSV